VALLYRQLPLSLSLARGGEDGGAGERKKNELGLPAGERWGGGVCSPETRMQPLISIRRLRSCRALLGLFWPRREEEMAARAQVVSPAAACARAGARKGAQAGC
jgi:hypothetical protein